MSKIIWDKRGERLFETGTDRGVLYTIDDVSGLYDFGVGWNGLTAVTQSPSGAEATPTYADNMKYLNLISLEEFGATIEAYTYPEEFEECNGSYALTDGVYVAQQGRKSFGFSYRSRLGNDLKGTDYGYKLHLVYGALAGPSEVPHATVNDSPEAAGLSWEITTTPVEVGTIGGVEYKPTSKVTIDSSKVAAAALADLEDILYGTPGTDPRLPLPAEVYALFSGTVTEVETQAPTYDSATDIVTIPAVTGVQYAVDGVDVPSGAFGPITDDVIVTARPQPGFVLSDNSDDDWVINFA